MKYTCEKANQIPIKELILKLNIKIAKQKKENLWCYSPFREEKTPSFKANMEKNTFYDFGNGYGGNNIDLIIKLKNCTVAESLAYFNNNFESFSFAQLTPFEKSNNDFDNKIEIQNIKPLTNLSLINYVKERGISLKNAKQYLLEIHYKVNDKNYFSLAMKNDKGGYELKNKYIGNSNSPKFLTSINNNCNSVIVTESTFDFLSIIELYPGKELQNDFIILHSLSFEKEAIKLAEKYTKIELYLDNDVAGKETALTFVCSLKNVNSKSNIYKNFKDINEYLIDFKKNQKLKKGKRKGRSL